MIQNGAYCGVQVKAGGDPKTELGRQLQNLI